MSAMAEEHAVTFAAGLASQGLLPVVAIYSTFFQRAYDQMIHDVWLMRLNVLFAVDRAGLVPGDGETHQGVYDPRLFQPDRHPDLFTGQLCRTCVLAGFACQRKTRSPVRSAMLAGRKPRRWRRLAAGGRLYDPILTHDGAKEVALVSYGAESEETLAAADLLKQQGGTG